MVWNLEDPNKKQKYNLNYIGLQLHVWFLFLAITKRATEFRKLQTQLMYQLIMKLFSLSFDVFQWAFSVPYVYVLESFPYREKVFDMW